MKMQIAHKLNSFLLEHSQIKKESDAVYIMVELRKLIDIEREESTNNKRLLIRFYANWVVHTSKDRVTIAMKKIMQKVSNSINIYSKNSNIEFISMPEFKKKLLELLDDYNLPNEFCQNNNWSIFVNSLTRVLANQPIINPTNDIAEFRYTTTNEKEILVDIDFRGKRAGLSVTLGII
jgi:hypothetical protein